MGSNFEKLAAALFGGPIRATDIKIETGAVAADCDELASELIASMRRMGLIVDGRLVDKSQST